MKLKKIIFVATLFILGVTMFNINENKKRHILNATRYFIYKNHLENKNIRFDVIEVYINQKHKVINHVKRVFF